MRKRGVFFTIAGLLIGATAVYMQSMMLGGISLYYISRYLFMSNSDFWRKKWFYLVPGMICAAVSVIGMFTILRELVLSLHKGEVGPRPLQEIIVFSIVLLIVEVGFMVFRLPPAQKELSGVLLAQRRIYAVVDRFAYLVPLGCGVAGFFYPLVSFAGIAGFCFLLLLHAGISETLRCASGVNRYLSRFSVFSS